MNEFPEALCWCLIATMATFIAVVREWPAPGLDDTQLGESSLSLELHRAQIPDRRVPSL